MTEPSGYVLEPLRKGGDFTLYRCRQHGNPSPLLLVALAADRPSPQGLRRLEREYSLAAELDASWAAVPLALTRYEGRTILVLKDPGGEVLDRILERDRVGDQRPLDLARVLGIAIGLARALCQVHRRGLIHKESCAPSCNAIPKPVSHTFPASTSIRRHISPAPKHPRPSRWKRRSVPTSCGLSSKRRVWLVAGTVPRTGLACLAPP
jgi:hypothetical protein